VCKGDVNPEVLFGFIALVPIPNEEGGILPPHSVLAPGTALGLLPSIALPSAQVNEMVTVVLARAVLETKDKEAPRD